MVIGEPLWEDVPVLMPAESPVRSPCCLVIEVSTKFLQYGIRNCHDLVQSYNTWVRKSRLAAWRESAAIKIPDRMIQYRFDYMACCCSGVAPEYLLAPPPEQPISHEQLYNALVEDLKKHLRVRGVHYILFYQQKVYVGAARVHRVRVGLR